MLILVGLYLFFLVCSLSFNNTKIIKVIIVLCFFQNIILVLFSRFLNNTTYNIITLSKDVYVILFLCKLIFENRSISSDVVFCLLTMLGLAGLMLVFGTGEMKGQLSCLRQLILPFMFYSVGRLCNFTTKQIDKILLFFVRITIIAVLFGFVEYALGERFWVPAGLTGYAHLKGTEQHLLENSMLRAFYTYITPTVRIRRMASVLVDAVIFTQIVAFSLIILQFYKGLYSVSGKNFLFRRSLNIIILIIGLFLSFGKGGIIIASLSYCILLREVSKSKIVSRLLLLAIIVIVWYYFVYSLSQELSGRAHFNGLINGLQIVIRNRPFGNGIGSEGNLAYVHGGFGYAKDGAGESYIGSMLAQTGLYGLITHIVVFMLCISKSNYNKYIDKDLCNIIRVLTMIMILTSFVNYASISFTSCYIYFILSGMTKGKHKLLKKLEVAEEDRIVQGKTMVLVPYM